MGRVRPVQAWFGRVRQARSGWSSRLGVAGKVGSGQVRLGQVWSGLAGWVSWVKVWCRESS